VLLDKYGFRVVHDSHSNLEARVSTILKNGSWFWRPMRFNQLVEIQNSLSLVTLREKDKPIWVVSKFGIIIFFVF
jgi:hypothetical protein